MKLSRLVGFAGLFLLVPTLVACGDESGEDATSETTAVEATTTTEVSAFSVTVGDLTLDSEPQRIVSMSATAT